MRSHDSSICSLCQAPSYPVIWEDNAFRIILINDQSYPGYCRVESIEHFKEMTDMDPSLRNRCMSIVFEVERILRFFLRPDKINLSSLGNITPHCHWHIIPRYKNDNHFPLSIWSNKKRRSSKELKKGDQDKLIQLIRIALDQ